MNGPFNAPALAMPSEFESLSHPLLLLPGEDPKHYHALREAIFAQLAPHSAIDWLLAIDIAEISWEIRRYRILRHKVLETFRQKAVETALRRIDMVGIGPDLEYQAEIYTIHNALSWRVDPLAASEIEARLLTHGFDQHAISMEVYAQAREIFLLFDGLLNAAQAKRLLMLKEIRVIRDRPIRALEQQKYRPAPSSAP